jgi:threonine dehydratase
MGVEIFEQVPDVDVIIVPTGGGGLLAGICVAIKALKPDCQVELLNTVTLWHYLQILTHLTYLLY